MKPWGMIFLLFFHVCGCKLFKRTSDVKESPAIENQSHNSQCYNGDVNSEGIDIYDPFAEEALTFYKLKEIIQTERLNSVEAVLNYFKGHEVYKYFLENPVLNPKSTALHASSISPDFPRIIIHMQRIIIMFVGHPDRPGSQQFEIQEFDPVEKRWFFRLIAFGEKDAEGNVADSGFIENAADFDFDRTNPNFSGASACEVCHRESREGGRWREEKPRWSNDLVWRVPYGRFEGKIYEGTRHFGWWAEFQNSLQTPTAVRYRFMKLSATNVGFSNGKQIISLVDRPNLALAKHIARMNFPRMGRLFREGPKYNMLKYAIIGSLAGCENTKEFFPNGKWEKRLEEIPTASMRSAGISAEAEFVSPQRLEQFLQENPGFRPEPGELLWLGLRHIFKISKPGEELAALEHFARGLSHRQLSVAIQGKTYSNPIANERVNGVKINGIPLDTGVSPYSIARQIKTNDDKDFPVVSRLIFLLHNNLPEDSQHWSTTEEYSYNDSYRFFNHVNGIRDLLRCELGPQFMTENDGWDSYQQILAGLQDPTPEFCDKIAERSRVAMENY